MAQEMEIINKRYKLQIQKYEKGNEKKTPTKTKSKSKKA